MNMSYLTNMHCKSRKCWLYCRSIGTSVNCQKHAYWF